MVLKIKCRPLPKILDYYPTRRLHIFDFTAKRSFTQLVVHNQLYATDIKQTVD